MGKDRVPTADQLAELQRLAGLAAVGATSFYAGDFPAVFDEMGVRQRTPSQNTYLGWTLTRPDDDTAVFGFAYEDAHDAAPANEDHFHVDLSKPLVRHLDGKKWEKEDPRWKGTHHGPKDYLKP